MKFPRLLVLLCASLPLAEIPAAKPQHPNIVIIYADDIGYGDVSCNGATAVSTPHIDRIAAEGLRFTDAHCAAATCTPSRYAMLTGEYAFRRPGTGILAGTAKMAIDPGRPTLPRMLQRAGFKTGVVGKWHLGLGDGKALDWNGDIAPGPLEIGFDHCFLIPATGDRVPCVYVENRRVVGLDPGDPLRVSYSNDIAGEPLGIEHLELLKMKFSHGHDQTIVNGISRIGRMEGGQSARWVDEDMADVITARAVDFIEKNRAEQFFLFFALHDIHVPRVPHPRFAGSTRMGPRGDAIVQADWCVGRVLEKLDALGLAEDTLVVFSSDNGPVLDDGYVDGAVENLGDHAPAGPLRGGKYSAYEAGTRVPMVLCWPARIRTPAVSEALLSQVDFFASFAALVGQELEPDAAPDSLDTLAAFLGESTTGRTELIEQAKVLSLREGTWKFIEPGTGPRINANTNTDMGIEPAGQLFDLSIDPGERNNLADKHPERAARMQARLDALRTAGASR